MAAPESKWAPSYLLIDKRSGERQRDYEKFLNNGSDIADPLPGSEESLEQADRLAPGSPS